MIQGWIMFMGFYLKQVLWPLFHPHIIGLRNSTRSKNQDSRWKGRWKPAFDGGKLLKQSSVFQTRIWKEFFWALQNIRFESICLLAWTLNQVGKSVTQIHIPPWKITKQGKDNKTGKNISFLGCMLKFGCLIMSLIKGSLTCQKNSVGRTCLS